MNALGWFPGFVGVRAVNPHRKNLVFPRRSRLEVIRRVDSPEKVLDCRRRSGRLPRLGGGSPHPGSIWYKRAFVDPGQQDTLDFQASTHGAAEERTIGLTLLAHPDTSRVGQVAVLYSALAGGARRLSRLEPAFSFLEPRAGEQGASVQGLGQAGGEPLNCPVLSRKPVLLKTTKQGSLRIESELPPDQLLLDGQPLSAPKEYELEQLTHGISIELRGCVLLLLHFIAVAREAPVAGILGDSCGVTRVRSEIQRVSDLDACVLIRGESGSGKELVARAIHDCSPRRSGPYIAVNAAAIPPTTAAAALFGHVRGAFTGAVGKSLGFFGEAERGTLFLDEIGEVPRSVQALLLRAIRERQVQPVGETQTRTVDVRVVAATDANLEALAEQGEFSLPLLRRLEAYSLFVPPLRERRDDIARLFFYFLRRELEEIGEASKLDEPPPEKKPWFPIRLVQALLESPWPGNVAELHTVARRIAIANRGHRHFVLDEWTSERLQWQQAVGQAPHPGRSSAAAQEPSSRKPKRDPRELSDEEIVEAMRRARFKINAGAEELGVSRSWLHTRLECCAGVRKAKELSAEEIEAALAQASDSVSGAAERLEVSEHGLKLRMAALGIRS